MLGNVLALILGILCLGGGGYLIYFWWGPFKTFFKGGIGLVLLFFGFLVAVFGYTGIKDELEERRRERELKELEEKEEKEAEEKAAAPSAEEGEKKEGEG